MKTPSLSFSNPYFTYNGSLEVDMKRKMQKLIGTGVLMFGDGSSYEGEFKDGEIVGNGVRRWPDGSIYTGEFSNGEFNGYGAYVGSNGEHYEGFFQNNARHGKGKLILNDGSVYEGDFLHHKPSGTGVLKKRLADGLIFFEGTFDRGKPSSRGKIIYQRDELKEQDVYIGSVVDAFIRHGRGILKVAITLSNDHICHIIYDGWWKGNKRTEIPTDLRVEYVGSISSRPQSATSFNLSDITVLKNKEPFTMKCFLCHNVKVEVKKKNQKVEDFELQKLSSESGRIISLSIFKIPEKYSETISKHLKQKNMEDFFEKLPDESEQIPFKVKNDTLNQFDAEIDVDDGSMVKYSTVSKSSFCAEFSHIVLCHKSGDQGIFALRFEDVLHKEGVKHRTLIPTGVRNPFYTWVFQYKQQKK